MSEQYFLLEILKSLTSGADVSDVSASIINRLESLLKPTIVINQLEDVKWPVCSHDYIESSSQLFVQCSKCGKPRHMGDM